MTRGNQVSAPLARYCYSQGPRRWRTWASTSTAGAGPGGGLMRRPGSTCCSRTGGIPASLTCPAARGPLEQVEGRTADDAVYSLALAAPAWRDAVRVVAIDMCTIYASAVRRMLPAANPRLRVSQSGQNMIV
jgi:hypothetical protein